MKYVELAPGIRSSAIGFGCGPILGSVDRNRAQKAIELSYSLGVNHFDVAPSYGYGEAEAFLGDFLKGKPRDKVVIATKFGIQVTSLGRVLSPLKSTARSLVKLVRKGSGGGGGGTASTKVGGGFGSKMHEHVPITAEGLTQSVERSLKRLQTDHIDFLLLHEPSEAIPSFESVVAAASALKKKGSLRAFGLASMLGELDPHRGYLDQFDVLQFNVPTENALYKKIRDERGAAPNMLFSPLSAMRGLSGDLASANSTAFLQRIHVDFPRSVVLCSMFSENHIQENVKALA